MEEKTKIMSFLKLWVTSDQDASNCRVHFSMRLSDGEYTSGSLSYDRRPKISSTVQTIYQLVSN